MPKRVRALIAVTALMSVVSTAHADPNESGFYGSVVVDGEFPQDSDINGLSSDLSPTLDSTLDGGFVVGGALGRSWSRLGHSVPRTELELAHRQGESDAAGLVGLGSVGNFGASADSSSTTLVGKIMLDVPIGESMLTPYLGAGVGVRQSDRGFTSGNGLPLDGTRDDYSAQVLAGVSHSLAEQLDLSLDGRYQRSLDGGIGAASSGTAADKEDAELGIFSLFIRLRAKF